MADEDKNEVRVNTASTENTDNTASKDAELATKNESDSKACEPCKPSDLTDDSDYLTRSFRDLNRFMTNWIGAPFTRFFDDDPFDYMFNAGRELDRRAHVFTNGMNAMLGNRARVYDNKDGSADILVDMPGVAKGDVNITYDDHGITVSHERHEQDENHREYSEYHEYVPLKDSLDLKSSTAKLEDGQLRIHVPAGAKPAEPDRSITVE